MKISNRGINLLKKHEGFRNHPYKDVGGLPTIGYGNTYYLDGSKVKMTDPPLTRAQGEELLREVLREFEEAVNRLVTSKIRQNQYDALVSFVYNVGIFSLQKSTLLKRVNADPDDSDIQYQFSRWCKVNGVPNRGLKRRRNEESWLYFEHTRELTT